MADKPETIEVEKQFIENLLYTFSGNTSFNNVRQTYYIASLREQYKKGKGKIIKSEYRIK